MLIIRLQRTGRANDPNFRVVVVESKRAPRSGSFLEVLGSYNPRGKSTIQFKEERIRHWLARGAQISATVHNLLIDAKIIEGKKRSVVPPLENPPKEEQPSSTASVTPNAAAETASD